MGLENPLATRELLQSLSGTELKLVIELTASQLA